MLRYSKQEVMLRRVGDSMTEKTKKKEWQSCGYMAKSKNPKVFVVMVKHVRYIVNVDGLQDVNSGKIEFTPIYEFVG